MSFEIITVLISSFIFNYMFFDYMNILFEKKIKAIPYIFFFLGATFIMAFVNIFENVYLNYMWSFIFCIILASFLYKNNSKQNNTFFCIFRFYGLELVIETLSAYLIDWIIGSMKFNYYVAVNLSSALLFCFFQIYKKYCLKKYDSVLFTTDFYLDIFSAVFCFFNIFLISLLSFENLPAYINVLFVIDAGGFLFMEMYLVFKLDGKEKKEKLQNQLKMMEIQQQNNLKYYESRIHEMGQYRKAIHDFKYKLSVLDDLYKKKNYQEASDYSDHLFHELNTVKKFSNNAILQSILTDIDSKCSQMNILFSCNIDPRIDFKGYDSLDLVSMYSNLFYNAIEANENEIEKIKKFLSVEIHINKEYINTIIENSYQSLHIENGEFISTKNKHYGIGIKNVKDMIDHLQGMISFEHEDYKFKVIIYLPLLNK